MNKMFYSVQYTSSIFKCFFFLHTNLNLIFYCKIKKQVLPIFIKIAGKNKRYVGGKQQNFEYYKNKQSKKKQ